MVCRRGSLLSTAIFLYAATTPINGYFGGSLYAKMGGSCEFFIEVIVWYICFVKCNKLILLYHCTQLRMILIWLVFASGSYSWL